MNKLLKKTIALALIFSMTSSNIKIIKAQDISTYDDSITESIKEKLVVNSNEVDNYNENSLSSMQIPNFITNNNEVKIYLEDEYKPEIKPSKSLFSAPVTITKNNIKLTIPQSSITLMSNDRFNQLVTEMDEIIRLSKEFVGIDKNEIIPIVISDDDGYFVSYSQPFTIGGGYFKYIIETDINQGRMDGIVYSLNSAVIKYASSVIIGNINFWNNSINVYDLLMASYCIENMNLTMQELSGDYTRNNHTGINFKNCLLNDYTNVMTDTHSYPFFESRSFTYSLLGIKEKIGWEPFITSMNELFERSKEGQYALDIRVNIFLDSLARASNENIHDMFTAKEIEEYEKRMNGKLGGLSQDTNPLIIVQDVQDDRITTSAELINIKAEIKNVNKINSVSYKYNSTKNNSVENKELDPDKIVNIQNHGLDLGANFLTIDVNYDDDKIISKDISIIRTSTELILNDNVKIADNNESNEIFNKMFDYYTIKDDQGNDCSAIIVSSDNLLVTRFGTQYKKGDIVVVKRDDRPGSNIKLDRIETVSFLLNSLDSQSTDYLADKTDIENYNNENYKVVIAYDILITDLYSNEVCLDIHQIDLDNPIAFRYSPYANLDNTSKARTLNNPEGFQFQNFVDLFPNRELITGGYEGNDSPISFKLAPQKSEGNNDGEDDYIIVYDEDGNYETESDQIKLSYSFMLKDFKVTYHQVNEAGQLPKQILSYLEFAEEDEINIKADLASFGLTKKIYEFNKEANKNFENKNILLEGPNIYEDQLVLAALGVNLKMSGVTIKGPTLGDCETVTPTIVFLLILETKLDGSITLKITPTYQAYEMNGFNFKKNSYASPYDSDVKISKASTLRQKFGEYDLYSIQRNSKSENDISKPSWDIKTELTGKFEALYGLGLGAGIMVANMMPDVIKISALAKFDGQLSDSQLNIYNGNFDVTPTINGNLGIETGVYWKNYFELSGFGKKLSSTPEDPLPIVSAQKRFGNSKLFGTVIEVNQGVTSSSEDAKVKISKVENPTSENDIIAEVTTDSKGNFKFYTLKMDEIWLIVEKNGYITHKEKFDFNKEELKKDVIISKTDFIGVTTNQDDVNLRIFYASNYRPVINYFNTRMLDKQTPLTFDVNKNKYILIATKKGFEPVIKEVEFTGVGSLSVKMDFTTLLEDGDNRSGVIIGYIYDTKTTNIFIYRGSDPYGENHNLLTPTRTFMYRAEPTEKNKEYFFNVASDGKIYNNIDICENENPAQIQNPKKFSNLDEAEIKSLQIWINK